MKVFSVRIFWYWQEGHKCVLKWWEIELVSDRGSVKYLERGVVFRLIWVLILLKQHSPSGHLNYIGEKILKIFYWKCLHTTQRKKRQKLKILEAQYMQMNSLSQNKINFECSSHLLKSLLHFSTNLTSSEVLLFHKFPSDLFFLLLLI